MLRRNGNRLKKVFFSEEKKQKTFANFSAASGDARQDRGNTKR
jgi:hypothetical protein